MTYGFVIACDGFTIRFVKHEGGAVGLEVVTNEGITLKDEVNEDHIYELADWLTRNQRESGGRKVIRRSTASNT